MPRPFGDLAKVRLPQPNEHGFVGADETSKDAAQGILIELPDKLPYLGFYSFAFEHSYNNPDNAAILKDYYGPLVGKHVWWSSTKERGSVLKEADGNIYAYVKLTDIMAYGEPEEVATNTYGRDGEIKL